MVSDLLQLVRLGAEGLVTRVKALSLPALIGVGATAVVVGLVGIWLLGGFGISAGVLDVADPTESQMQQIAELLLVGDDEVRNRATGRLVQLGARAVPALKGLAPRGFREVSVTLPLLIAIDAGAAIEVCDGLLSHDDPVVRSTALQLIQTLADDERTIALWVKALGDSDSGIREDVCRRLADTPPQHRKIATDGLMRLRSDASEEVRVQAAAALRALTGRDHAKEFRI